MGLTEESFVITAPNYKNVKLTVIDGVLEITGDTVVTVEGSVNWNDLDDLYETRPEQVIVEIYADGEPTGIFVTADADGVWHFTAEDLPKFDEEGKHEIEYTVVIQPVAGYETSYDGDDIRMTLRQHTLTVLYYQNGEVIDIFNAPYYFGQNYSVVSSAITGYKPDIDRVEGTMGDDDISVIVSYNAIEYTLTVQYVDQSDGHVLHNEDTYTYHYGDAYSVVPRTFMTYKPILGEVTGTMPASNRTITLLYVKTDSPDAPKIIVIDNFSVPLGITSVSLTSGECAE